jgi:predicted SAM-dependent methyltransferase
LQIIKKKKTNAPQKINLGSGSFKKEGFLNVDLFPPADLTLALRLGLPFSSESCDFIFSEHCLEHFGYPNPILNIFKDCFRILKN